MLTEATIIHVDGRTRFWRNNDGSISACFSADHQAWGAVRVYSLAASAGYIADLCARNGKELALIQGIINLMRS